MTAIASAPMITFLVFTGINSVALLHRNAVQSVKDKQREDPATLVLGLS